MTIQNKKPNAISFDVIYISLEGEVNLLNVSMNCNSQYLSGKFLKIDSKISKEQLTLEKKPETIVILGFDKSK